MGGSCRADGAPSWREGLLRQTAEIAKWFRFETHACVGSRVCPTTVAGLLLGASVGGEGVAQSGNGVDLGTIYQLLSEVAETVRSHSEEFVRVNGKLNELIGTVGQHTRKLNELVGTVGQHTQKLNELVGTVNEHSRRFDQISAVLNEHGRTLGEQGRKLDDVSFGVNDLRSTVADYHQTVTGHGIHYTELEERVDKVERYLKLESN
jgi:hypothetical protein